MGMSAIVGGILTIASLINSGGKRL